MKTDEPQLLETAAGVTVRYRGRTLYAPSDPVGSALRRVRRYLSSPHIERSLVFVPSVGLGYGLAELLAGLPAQDPAALEIASQAAIDCGEDPAIIDGALTEFAGG